MKNLDFQCSNRQSRGCKIEKFPRTVGPNHGWASLDTEHVQPPNQSILLRVCHCTVDFVLSELILVFFLQFLKNILWKTFLYFCFTNLSYNFKWSLLLKKIKCAWLKSKNMTDNLNNFGLQKFFSVGGWLEYICLFNYKAGKKVSFHRKKLEKRSFFRTKRLEF